MREFLFSVLNVPGRMSNLASRFTLACPLARCTVPVYRLSARGLSAKECRNRCVGSFFKGCAMSKVPLDLVKVPSLAIDAASVLLLVYIWAKVTGTDINRRKFKQT